MLSGWWRYDIPAALQDFDESKAFSGEKGILTLIADNFRTLGSYSVIRFWITRAMESFLRGETDPVHQLFLIDKDVIEVWNWNKTYKNSFQKKQKINVIWNSR